MRVRLRVDIILRQLQWYLAYSFMWCPPSCPTFPILSLPPSVNQVKRVRFSPHGRALATTCGDASVRLWDMRTFQCYSSLTVPMQGGNSEKAGGGQFCYTSTEQKRRGHLLIPSAVHLLNYVYYFGFLSLQCYRSALQLCCRGVKRVDLLC